MKSVKRGILTLIPRKYLPSGKGGNTVTNTFQCVQVMDPAAVKSWRGWESPVTARLLCPIDYVAQFEADPDECVTTFDFLRFLIPFVSTRRKLRQQELPLNDSAGDPKFPAFLYDESATDGSLSAGLFHGPLLLAVSPTIHARGIITNRTHSGLHFHLLIAFWCYRHEGIVETRERQDPWNGERGSCDNMLCSGSRLY